MRNKNQFQPELVERYAEAIYEVRQLSFKKNLPAKRIKTLVKKFKTPVVFTTLLIRMNCLIKTERGVYTWNEKMKLETSNAFREKAKEMISMNREGAKKSIKKKSAPKPKPETVTLKSVENLTTLEVAIKIVKAAGLKVMKPTSGWEEI